MTKKLIEAKDLLELAVHVGARIGQEASSEANSLWRGVMLIVDEARQRVEDVENTLESLDMRVSPTFEVERGTSIAAGAEKNSGVVRQLMERDGEGANVLEVRKRA